jgi:hypothetical protein
MALFGFGKRIKPKEFGFMPRYYDKDKEDLQARLAKYDREVDNAELMKARIRSRFKYHSGEGTPSYREASRKSNFRLVLIIMTLALAAYVILQSDGILNLLDSITNGRMN